jgi:2-aminomuconate deaminase
MSESRSFESERAPEPVGAYPHARRVGDLLFLSGIGPRRRGSKEIPGVMLDAAGNVVDHDVEAQTRSVMENVRAVLEASGSSWDRIVDVTVFLTDMKRDFATFNRVYAEHFGSDLSRNPTRTTVEVGALPTPIAVELKVIATVG